MAFVHVNRQRKFAGNVDGQLQLYPCMSKRVRFFLPAIILVLCFCMKAVPAFAQVRGCTDPAALNYNPSATVNDGSCTYPKTIYAPPVKTDPLSAVLDESSGLQWAGGSLWSFNDGGNAAVLFRMDTASAKILQTVTLESATNVDWEGIPFDATHLYICGFG